MSAGTAPAGTRAEELAWLAEVLWGPTPEVELVVGGRPPDGWRAMPQRDMTHTLSVVPGRHAASIHRS